MEIRQRRLFVADVPAPLESPYGTTEQHNGYIARIVTLTLGHAGSVNESEMIEQRSVTIGSFAVFLQQMSKQSCVVLIDFRQLFKLLGLSAMMRKRVVGIRYPDVRVR